jgi:hypothetical protein
MTLEMNSLPLSTLIILGKPPLHCNAVERIHDILSFQVLAHRDGQALSRIVIHYCQCPQASAIEQRIGNEIHAPDLIHRRNKVFGLAQSRRLVAPGRLNRSDSPSSRYNR